MWGQSDNQLQKEHKIASHERDYSRKHKLERELEDRGYVEAGMFGWEKKPEEVPVDDYNDYDDENVSRVSLIRLLFFIMAIGFLGATLNDFIRELVYTSRDMFPTENWYSTNIIGNKIGINIFTIFISLFIIGIIKVLGMRFLYPLILISLIIGACSMLYYESSQMNEFPIFSTIFFSVCLIGSVLLLFYFNKERKVSLMIIGISTIGFIIAGNGYVYAWYFLYTYGALCFFYKHMYKRSN